LQHTGSFKPRGAFHNLLTRDAPAIGCAAASGGNHGAAAACAAGKLGVKARIFAPEIAAPLDAILVAVGGGGLIAGVAAWFEGRVKIVGVEPEGSCALYAALAAGRPVDVSVRSVAADSLGPRSVGEPNFAIVRRAGRARRAGERRGDSGGAAPSLARFFDHRRARRPGGLFGLDERRLPPGAGRARRRARLRRQHDLTPFAAAAVL
jgi:hypothetical protein